MDANRVNKSPLEKVNLTTEINQHIEMFKPKFSGKITANFSAKQKTKLLPKQDFLQVFDILLDNATKYGDKNIIITLKNNTLSVSNDGTIVPKQDLVKIFDRFYQTDKSKSGSGLGLAIAKAICQQNGWDIICDSSKNQTTFTLNIPYR